MRLGCFPRVTLSGGEGAGWLSNGAGRSCDALRLPKMGGDASMMKIYLLVEVTVSVASES